MDDQSESSHGEHSVHAHHRSRSLSTRRLPAHLALPPPSTWQLAYPTLTHLPPNPLRRMATPRPTPKFMSPLAGPSIPPTSGGTKRKLTAVDENAPASSTAGGGRAKRSAHLLSTTGIGLAHERKVFYGINQAANDAAAEEDTEATYW